MAGNPKGTTPKGDETMADEAEVVEEKVESTDSQEEKVETTEGSETQEAKPEGQPQEGTTEGKEETEETQEAQEENPDEQFVFKTVVDGNEVVWDTRKPDDRKQILDNASKGFHYSKRLAAVAELEKSLKGWADIGRAVISDPSFLQIQTARQMKVDPSVLYAEPIAPPEWMKESDPAEYGRLVAKNAFAEQAKQMVIGAAEQAKKNYATQTNQLVFEKASLQLDLSDSQRGQLENYVNQKVRTNQMGVYEYEDVEGAYWALFGKQKTAGEKLKTSEQIRKTIKDGTKNAPSKVSSQKHERLTKAQQEERSYTEYLKSIS